MSLRKTLAKVLLLGILEMGAICGVPITPEKIEQLMKMNDTKIAHVIRSDDGEPPTPSRR